MKKISIITICYNEPSLEETCKSIVNQTFQDFEWIVIDAGSNQKTLDIFDKYKERIDYFVSEPDGGRYNGMNKGIKVATGEYLNFMNAGDCFFAPDVLAKVNDEINKAQENEIFYGNGCFKKDIKCLKIMTPKDITQAFLYGNSLFHQAMFFNLSLFKQYGLYDESLKVVSDWKYYLELCKNGVKFKHLEILIAQDDIMGISNENKGLCELERAEVLKKMYTELEQKKLNIEAKKAYNKFMFEQLRTQVSRG